MVREVEWVFSGKMKAKGSDIRMFYALARFILPSKVCHVSYNIYIYQAILEARAGALLIKTVILPRVREYV